VAGKWVPITLPTTGYLDAESAQYVTLLANCR
jgi:hypothetical protein